jgi:hypothetical protein
MKNAKTSYRIGFAASIFFAINFGLGGCASSNDLIAANTNPVNGEPKYRSPPASAATQLEDRASQIRNQTGKALQDLLAYAPLHPEVFEEVKVQQVGSTTELKFISSKKGFFPAGVYVLNKIERAEDRDGLIFTDLVANATRKVLDAVKDKAGEIVIEATYAAQADGLPVRNLRYRGEFGDVIHLPSEITRLNSNPTTVHITRGQPIDNGQLAALRAVSMVSFFRGALRAHTVNDRYVLTTTKESGPQHRWVELTVKIVPAP